MDCASLLSPESHVSNRDVVSSRLCPEVSVDPALQPPPFPSSRNITAMVHETQKEMMNLGVRQQSRVDMCLLFEFQNAEKFNDGSRSGDLVCKLAKNSKHGTLIPALQ